MDRTTKNLRDEVSELDLKVDSIIVDLKDLQGAVKLQNKMFDPKVLKVRVSCSRGDSFMFEK